jgi:hypothetical protein
VVTALSGETSLGPFAITKHVQKDLTDEQWLLLASAIEQADFWAKPTFRVRLAHEDYSTDAVTWNLEGRRGSGYHVLSRRPDEDKRFMEACRVFFELAGIAIRLP